MKLSKNVEEITLITEHNIKHIYLYSLLLEITYSIEEGGFKVRVNFKQADVDSCMQATGVEMDLVGEPS